MLTLAAMGGTEAAGNWPLITVRYDPQVNDQPEYFAKLMDIHREVPGSCDEVWLCSSSIGMPDSLRTEAQQIARLREICRERGIVAGFQQGRTLGHGVGHDGKGHAGDFPFSDDVWQIAVDGQRLVGVLCPRSPEVLAYEREYAKIFAGIGQVASFWLDDDLRLGVYKPQGCFCPRCLAAFNARSGGSWTRAELAEKLNGRNARESVRSAWIAFNEESLALYAAAAREGVEQGNPNCRLGYQAVWADTIYTGRDYRRLLAALSGPDGRRVGIRPGAGYYAEDNPRAMIAKAISVAREAERCRDLGFVGSVCYEQETYPRRILQKSPGAIVTECTLALASGCDAVSLYWYRGENPEPLDEYRRASRAVAAARPYWERLSAVVR